MPTIIAFHFVFCLGVSTEMIYRFVLKKKTGSEKQQRETANETKFV